MTERQFDMRIRRIRVWKVPLTSHETYYMADKKTCDTVDSIIVSLHTDSGLTGWGEVCPIPHYLAAYADGVAPAIAEMAPVLLRSDPIGPPAVMKHLNAWLPGHDYAKSAIDTALWDLTGKAAGLPLYRLLGGLHSMSLPLYHSITCIAPDAMVAIALDAYAQGIRQFQIKLGADGDWQADVERLVRVREAIGDGALVYGDWNCGAPLLDAIRVARAVSHLDIMLEQPCGSLENCASVKRACGLPMKIDESAFDIASLLRAREMDCLDAVALKLSKFGGLSSMQTARDLCVHLGVKMCIEDTWGSDITTSAALHLAAATPARYVLNVCDLSAYVSPRLDETAPARKGGTLCPTDKAGHGVTPGPDVLGEMLLELE